MNRFHIGQAVWIKWHHTACPGARKHVCAIGEIIEGPFAPLHDFGWGYHIPDRSWLVRTDAGRVAAAEYVLMPFHDPDTDVETTDEQAVTA